ncbi:MAG: hypothetical protein HRU00_18100 [Myxococcales bacterium]|nr:hypothetical protein [Myxococcales bacterium]
MSVADKPVEVENTAPLPVLPKADTPVSIRKAGGNTWIVDRMMTMMENKDARDAELGEQESRRSNRLSMLLIGVVALLVSGIVGTGFMLKYGGIEVGVDAPDAPDAQQSDE